MKNLFPILCCLLISAKAFSANDLEQVKSRFTADYSQDCDDDALNSNDPLKKIEIYDISYTAPVSGNVLKYKLFELFCYAGAYNIAKVFYLVSEFGTITALQFAAVEVDEKYKVTGISTSPFLVNSHFNLEKLEMTSHEKGRGIGDAFTHGIWKFKGEGFALIKYDVDLTFDEEINPVTVFEVK